MLVPLPFAQGLINMPFATAMSALLQMSFRSPADVMAAMFAAALARFSHTHSLSVSSCRLVY